MYNLNDTLYILAHGSDKEMMSFAERDMAKSLIGIQIGIQRKKMILLVFFKSIALIYADNIH